MTTVKTLAIEFCDIIRTPSSAVKQVYDMPNTFRGSLLVSALIITSCYGVIHLFL